MDCVLVCRNHGWVTELNNKTAQVNCSKEISSYFFSLVDFVIRFITMALKSMVVVQHRKIIPYRRRVTVSVFLFIFVFLIFVFLIIYQILPELPGVTCKWKLVLYTDWWWPLQYYQQEVSGLYDIKLCHTVMM